MTDSATPAHGGRLLGHPAGLFTLFFAEMWERFSYYGMRALLTLYMVKGFLGYNDDDALTVYGGYTALVYMTPFFGGMLADKLLGQRRAVILGGILMSLGHLTMTYENEYVFFAALGLLIVGNGFFKPNISTMVGQLYPAGDKDRRGGFTIFYMGINLGAALSPLLCGYVGETYGWHYGFGLATIGMMIGLAVFWAPTLVAQILIGLGAATTAVLMVVLQSDNNAILLALYAFMAVALLVSAGIAVVALARGGLPDEVGAPPSEEGLKAPGPLGMPRAKFVYLASFVAVPVLAVLVGISRKVQLIPKESLESWTESDSGFLNVVGEIAGSVSTPAGLVLALAGVVSLVYLVGQALKMQKIARERMFTALILIFFSMLFWAFFEQAGGSMNLFTDRNVDRVLESRTVAADEVGQTLRMRTPLETLDPDLAELLPLTQEQFGMVIPDSGIAAAAETAARMAAAAKPELAPEQYAEAAEELDAFVAELAKSPLLTNTAVTKLRDAALQDAKPVPFDEVAGLGDTSWEDAKRQVSTVEWRLSEDHVGMGVGGTEVPASTYQSANAIFILLFGLVFSWLWGFLRANNLEPNTAVKFALGLIQVGLGFFALWYGASIADERGMVGMSWLLLGYLLHTTGELCLSPVGLSMITELSPRRLVSTMMGMWFLATAFSNYLAAIIGSFTSVDTGGEGSGVIPPPQETVDTYGEVFFQIGIAGSIAGLACLLLSPLLKHWSHEDQPPPE